MEKVKEKYGVVLFDTPPVLAVVDPVITSSIADSIVLVVQAGKTTRKPFRHAVDELRRAKADILGVIFNEAKARKKGYYSSYYIYYRHSYYGSSE